ncbi:MAG: fasciclin domain-containing protein [Caldilineaceae bacterium]|nr:fasciclin domain-containing protein [Caldilineaceae bacterium]MCB9121347.1 fasciclin domain-containing protein [Caldilineaceae bacterium]
MKHQIRKAVQVFIVLALALSLMPTQAAFAQDADIVDTAVAAGNFTTLVTAVQAAGLVDALKGEGPFTVFAPTDEAFAKLPAETLQAALADPQGLLTQVLLYHVVPGKVMAADLSDGMEAATLQGENVAFTLGDGVAMVNDANIIATDIETSNGVIHVIDTVILPPSITGAAMSEEAMAEEPAAEAASSEAAPAEEAAAEASSEEAMADMADIVDTAVAAGSFNTLVAAVQAAGLVDALKGEGPFTVFAPTDDAFAALPEGTVDALLADPTGDLTQILLYHVVPGKVMAADLSDGMEAATLQGKSVTFTLGDGVAMVNDANIIATDIETSNGVIHVIDSVILPPADEAMAEEAMAEEAAPAEAMTEASAEAAPAEAASGDAAAEQAPERMPVTGGEQNNALGLIVAALALVVVGGLAFASRRRLA